MMIPYYRSPSYHYKVGQLQSTVHDVKIGIGSNRKNPAFDGVMKARDIVKTSKSTVNCTSFYQQFHCDVQVFGD
jgi:hypothetical protein